MLIGRSGGVELDCKDDRELLDAKWVKGPETLEQTSCTFSFLFIDVRQYSRVCFIQTLWQVGYGAENLSRRAETQAVNLADDPLDPM
jgi:hypothetical protein